MCDRLDESEQEAMDIMMQLLDRYKEEKDSKNCYKLSQEIEQIEIEYTSAQNRAQEVLDSYLLDLNEKSTYQPDEHGSKIHSKEATVERKADHLSQSVKSNSGQRVVSVGHLGLNEGQDDNFIDPELLGQDLWKQLKRVNILVFSGDKRTYQNWKAAFMACVDKAPATAEYKLLQLRQCLTGEALKAIKSLGYSAVAYETAKERLERKFGGQRRQIALYLEEIDSFKPVRYGNTRDLEKYADLLDIANLLL